MRTARNASCPGCHTIIEAPHHYCPHCGVPLQRGADLFSGAPPRPVVSDKGYLLVAIGSVLNGLTYAVLGWIGSQYLSPEEYARFIRFQGLLYPVFLFTVLFLFARRPGFRVAIGLIALLSIGSSLYTALFLY